MNVTANERCLGCPFNDGLTEEASIAQNYGCLPTANEMIERFDKSGLALSCHEESKIACRGLSEVRDTQDSEVLGYPEWYRGA